MRWGEQQETSGDEVTDKVTEIGWEDKSKDLGVEAGLCNNTVCNNK